MNDARTALLAFYELVDELRSKPGQGRPLSEVMTEGRLPREGVYFFFEPGEFRAGLPGQPRVVRVGTHGVSARAKSTLRGRLRSHAGSRSGGGNHRGSIFRFHIGNALLQREGGSLASWGRGSSLPLDVRSDEAALAAERLWEQKVSAYIRLMPVVWVNAPGESSALNLRAYLETNAIALLSNGLSPVEPATETWLGRHSPNEIIRRSALWNLKCVNRVCDSEFLTLLGEAVRRT